MPRKIENCDLKLKKIDHKTGEYTFECIDFLPKCLMPKNRVFMFLGEYYYMCGMSRENGYVEVEAYKMAVIRGTKVK